MHTKFLRQIKFSLFTTLTGLALSFSSCASAQNSKVQLSSGIYAIHAEVAATEAERQKGLMMRTHMNPNEGMIFDFGADAAVCMWMKNTYIALSVAFIDSTGKIVNIEDMRPETTDSHCATKKVRYALEMNQGWFKQKNIKAGSMITGIPLKR